MGHEATGRGHRRDASRSAVARGMVGLVLLVAAAGCSDAPGGSANHAWLELGPGGERIARVITTDTTCPSLDIDDRTVTMQVRALPDPPLFPVLTCEATVPAEAARAAI